jgi:hypothetical protein
MKTSGSESIGPIPVAEIQVPPSLVIDTETALAEIRILTPVLEPAVEAEARGITLEQELSRRMRVAGNRLAVSSSSESYIEPRIVGRIMDSKVMNWVLSRGGIFDSPHDKWDD